MNTQITYEQAEHIQRKLIIMQATVTALCNRVEEYNPADELAEAAEYSIRDLRDALKTVEP